MNGSRITHWIKETVGRLPGTAEAYQRWIVRDRHPTTGYAMDQLVRDLPEWVEHVREARSRDGVSEPRRVLVFAYRQTWFEYATALSLLLAGVGHHVDLAFLPYRRWFETVSDFDVRRQQSYIREVLAPLGDLVHVQNLLRLKRKALPPTWRGEIEKQSLLDVQYILQREDVDPGLDGEAGGLYRFRLRRNLHVAEAAHSLLTERSHDVVMIPNGSVLEFGAFYRIARKLGVHTVTFEFGEQRERMWLAQNDEVMRLDTRDLWRARGELPLSESELSALRSLYAARRGAQIWENFRRRWQAQESQGAQAARRELGLDPGKPVVLICTNVVGDSLALNRQVFTEGMADWLMGAVRHLAKRSDVEILVRVHPGELLGAGHPSVEIVRGALPELPSHVHIIPPESEINTYDLIELAHLGMVYTTTVGLEMVMSGVPVVVAGATHYRGKGFTHDPESWDEFGGAVDGLLSRPLGQRLPQEQVELAWRYAYRFFFEYPFPFPWHLVDFWEDVRNRSLGDLLSPGGLVPYARTIKALLGDPVDWSNPTEPVADAISGMCS